MRNPILQFAFFLVTFLVISFAVSSLLINSSDGQIRRAKRDINNTDQLLTLIAGDSQALRGIDPRKFKSAFNFASVGENSILSYYKIKNTLKHHPELTDIILSINLHSFSEYRTDKFARIYQWRDMINFAEVAMIKKDPGLYLWKFFKAYFFAYERKGRKLLQKNKSHKPKIIKKDYIKGFQPLTAEAFNSVMDRAIKYYADKNIYDDSLIKYYEKIFELAQTQGITVHLVRMPMTEEFYNESGKYIKYKDFKNIIEGFQKKYNNVYFYDHIKDFSDNESVFFDDLHLNHQGAEILSNKLAHQLHI